MLYDYIAGDHPDDSDYDAYFRAGTLLKSLHKLGQKIKNSMPLDWAGCNRPIYDFNDVVMDSLDTLKKLDYVDAQRVNILESVKNYLVKNYPKDVTFIHGDFHFGNILIEDNDFRIIDFDECGFGSIYYDLGTMALHMLSQGNSKGWQEFLRGYGVHLTDKNLISGALARILFLTAKIPFRMDVPSIAENYAQIIQRYISYMDGIMLEEKII